MMGCALSEENHEWEQHESYAHISLTSKMSQSRDEWLSVKEVGCVMIMFLYSEEFECD